MMMRTPPFTAGDHGVDTWRIPSMIVATDGSLIVACEARLLNAGDHGGPIRIATRRSVDGGVTWGDPVYAAQNIAVDGTEHVAQNPSLCVDRDTGALWMMFNATEHPERDIAAGRGVRRVLVTRSDDHGQTWHDPVDISAQVRPLGADWRCMFPPVGHGIQLRNGWLAFPSYVTIGDRSIFQGRVAMIWSDDHGQTWRVSHPAPDLGANECMGVERRDGSILCTVRSYRTPLWDVAPQRDEIVFSWSDGWIGSPTRAVPEIPLTRTGMQAAVIRWGGEEGPLVLSTAAHPEERRAMTLFVSDDDGATWPRSICVDDGPCAYSDLATLPDGRLAVLYESGDGPLHLRLMVLDLEDIAG